MTRRKGFVWYIFKKEIFGFTIGFIVGVIATLAVLFFEALPFLNELVASSGGGGGGQTGGSIGLLLLALDSKVRGE